MRSVTRVLALIVTSSALGILGCSGNFHSDDGLRDMECDETGCFHCTAGSCEEYRCSQTHQCPMERTCSSDGHCLVGPGSDKCDSHDDCAANQICTTDGTCVTSPGGGPGKDAIGETSQPEVVTDTAAETGPDTTLPDHPDDVCRTNADCGADGTCVNGGCYFACTVDGKCPPGQACEAANGSGQCRAAPPENACTFNGECGTNHACLEGTCYLRCEETLDCIAHTRCASGICIADTTPVIQCSGPGSCTDGKTCVDGKCLAACVDGACGAGLSCDLGFCTQVATCFDSNDCGGKDCIDGACAP